MANTSHDIDTTTIYQVCAYEKGGGKITATIRTLGMSVGETALFISEVTPPLAFHHAAVLKSLGAGVTGALGAEHSTIAFTPEGARKMFIDSEDIPQGVDGRTIGHQLVELLYTGDEQTFPY